MYARFRLHVLALLGIVVVTACGGGSTSTASEARSSGDVPLVVARVKDAVILDPAQASDGMSLNLTQEVMKGLVEFKPGGFEVEPAIAKSWTTSPDGRTWTFTLRKGLQFSDGTPIDADAVKFNFDRWRLLSDPYHGNLAYTYYAVMFGGFPGLISDVRVPKADTVIFTLTRAFSPFLHDVAMPAFAIGSPSAIRNDLAGFGQHPVGWGPFTLAEWVKDDHITLKANPHYPVQSFYKTIVIRDIPDPATSVLEVQKGDVDILTDLRPDDAAELSKDPKLTVYYDPANNNSYLAMNMDRPPFQKLAVRQAVAYAIDVAGIVKAFYPKGAVVANNWTPPGMMGDNPAVKAYPYDPAKAKALLAGAGLPNGFSSELYYSTIPRPYMPEPQRVAEAVQAQLKQVGIAITLQPFEWGVLLDKLHNGENPMALIGWSGDNGDPDNFMYTLLDKDSAHRPNSQNYSFWRDERFHQLMIDGQITNDPIERALTYRRANAMIHDQVPAIPIVHVTVPVVVKASIGGFIPSPDTHIMFEYLKPKS